LNVNPYRYRSLYEALTKLIEQYNVKLITAAEIMEELVKIVHELKKQMEQGKQLDLTDEELAFYDCASSSKMVILKFEYAKGTRIMEKS